MIAQPDTIREAIKATKRQEQIMAGMPEFDRVEYCNNADSRLITMARLLHMQELEE